MSADSISGASGPLQGANITCKGNRLNLIGGPLLEPFAPAFQGEWPLHSTLCASTITVCSDWLGRSR